MEQPIGPQTSQQLTGFSTGTITVDCDGFIISINNKIATTNITIFLAIGFIFSPLGD